MSRLCLLLCALVVLPLGLAPGARASAGSASRDGAWAASWTSTREPAAFALHVEPPTTGTMLQLQPREAALRIAPRHAWVLDESRAFWTASGAAAVTSVGAHLLVGVPTLALGWGLLAPALAVTPVALPAVLGVLALYALAESALSASVGVVVFNGVNRIYDTDWLAAFAGHLAGDALALGVGALTFGGGGLVFLGATQLASFGGGGIVSAVGVFSFLGALPAFVALGVAVVAVPALCAGWAMSVAARPRAPYGVDGAWQSALPIVPPAPASSRSDASVATLAAMPLASW